MILWSVLPIMRGPIHCRRTEGVSKMAYDLCDFCTALLNCLMKAVWNG